MPAGLYIPNVNKIIHETNVDLKKRIVQPTIHLVQYDHGMPIIAVHVHSDYIPYSIPVTADVHMRWLKRDRTYSYMPSLGCNEDRTIVYFQVTEQMTLLDGFINAIIEIRDDNTVAGSSYIPVKVNKNPINQSTLESTKENETTIVIDGGGF